VNERLGYANPSDPKGKQGIQNIKPFPAATVFDVSSQAQDVCTVRFSTLV
jgi:hypothetical protein